jgi:hypothetical protein
MYEISEQDSEFLSLTANEHTYINMLLKHAYQKWYCECIDDFKIYINPNK